tara:strand:- start:128 stop:388 length:261 start_codon:yes stop_codon:yes gene_type:complete
MKEVFSVFLILRFCVEKEENITLGVIRALDSVTRARNQQINKYVSQLIKPVFISYVRIKGSGVYTALLNGYPIYKSTVLKEHSVVF